MDYCFLSLLPNYCEREGSSLIYMVDDLMKKSQHPKSTSYLNDYEKLAEMTDGLSGADVAAIANTAVSLVVHEHLDSAPDAKEVTE